MNRDSWPRLLLCIGVALLLQTGCNSTRLNTGNTTPEPLIDNKISALLQQSKALSTSPGIVLLAAKAEENIYDAEPLYDLAYVHLKHAQATQNIVELKLAAAYFNEILLLLPGNQAVITSLYNIYYDDVLHGRNSEALASAKALLLQMPETMQATMNPPSLALFVATARRQDAQQQADRQLLREILLQAIQEQPRNDSAYIQLARIYTQDRYFSLAIATLKLAAEQIADSVELYTAIASTYEKRASSHNCHYEYPGDIANITKYYKLAIPLKPQDQELHYNLANALIDQQQKFLALNESTIALELGQTSTALGITAQDYSVLGYPHKANELLALALGKGLSIGDPRYHEIQMNQGNWQLAANGFAAYLKQQKTVTVYDFIKGDIIAQQAQTQPLLTPDKIKPNNPWEENLLNYWNATTSDETLKKTALNRCEKTEYYFYTGYKDLRNGHTAQAKTKFAAALKQNTYRFIERPLAQYFLQR